MLRFFRFLEIRRINHNDVIKISCLTRLCLCDNISPFNNGQDRALLNCWWLFETLNKCESGYVYIFCKSYFNSSIITVGVDSSQKLLAQLHRLKCRHHFNILARLKFDIWKIFSVCIGFSWCARRHVISLFVLGNLLSMRLLMFKEQIEGWLGFEISLLSWLNYFLWFLKVFFLVVKATG